ncbi:hypothetical protein GE09DRAFT_334585 [Coniochaeta sp. 2T2.1]|nr:hypothetical protein GE09DRAFT_334585 [Coniochaeta sp. 2T2.1]
MMNYRSTIPPHIRTSACYARNNNILSDSHHSTTSSRDSRHGRITCSTNGVPTGIPSGSDRLSINASLLGLFPRRRPVSMGYWDSQRKRLFLGVVDSVVCFSGFLFLLLFLLSPQPLGMSFAVATDGRSRDLVVSGCLCWVLVLEGRVLWASGIRHQTMSGSLLRPCLLLGRGSLHDGPRCFGDPG